LDDGGSVDRNQAAGVGNVGAAKEYLTTSRNAKRNRATANEPRVRVSRTFLRKRFARMRRLNFMLHFPPTRIIFEKTLFTLTFMNDPG